MTLVRHCFAVPLSLGLALVLGSCKATPAQQEGASLRDAPAAPVPMSADCNLAVTAAQSDDAVRQQLTCLRSIGEAVGPGWATALASAADLVVTLNSWNTEPISLTEEEGAAPTQPPAADAPPGDTPPAADPGASLTDEPTAPTTPTALTVWGLINTAATMAADNTSVAAIRPRWLGRCLGDVREVSIQVKEATDAVRGLSENQSITLEALTNLITAVSSGTQASLRLGQTLLDCTPGNNKQAVASFKRLVDNFSTRLGGLTSALGPINAIVSCGVNITRGAIVLAHNTSCLVNDLIALRASNLAVQQAAQRTVPSLPRAEDTQAECDALAVRQTHRAGQFCAAGMSGYWYNSSIRRDCGTCCDRNLNSYINSGTCTTSGNVVSGLMSTCTERCYMAAGGT